jgi:deoxyribonuclease V
MAQAATFYRLEAVFCATNGRSLLQHRSGGFVMKKRRTPETTVIACLDAAYEEAAAGVACVLFTGWDSPEAAATLSRYFALTPAAYEPGAFYKRELPLLLEILGTADCAITTIIIDGYVWLGTDARPGLGAVLFSALDGKIPVIGAAKTRFRDDTWSVPVTRGKSGRPLFVTAAGMAAHEAADAIRTMHGEHRIPTMLNRADSAARTVLRRGAAAS